VSPALLALLARAATFALIVVLVGVAAFRWLVLPRSHERDGAALRSAARTGRAAAALLLPALGALFLAQFLDFREPTERATAEAALLLSIPWGRIWLVQCGLALALLLCYASAAREAAAPWRAAPLLAGSLAFTPALGGHAAAVEGLTVLAVAADGLHVLAAGTWMGTLFVLARASFGRTAADGPTLLARVNAFSPVALASATVVAATGTVGAWLHLPRLADLVTSNYGRLLSAKLLLFCAVLALGAFNWRRATPGLRESGDRRVLTRSIAAELGCVLLVILVTAWFVATSPPGP
jgi:putative copper export protein